MENDAAVYQRTLRRITIGILCIGASGAIAAAILRGWKFGIAFALGAALSYLSFWRWQRVAEGLGEASTHAGLGGMLLRFVLLAGAAYGIVKYLEVTPVAVFLGLFVAAAALFVAIIFELFYART